MKYKVKKYYKRYEEIINYIIVGALTTLVSLLSYYICTFTFLNPLDPIQLQIANIISWIMAVTFAYITNRIYVFKSKNKEVIKEALKFYSSRLLTLLLDMSLMFLIVTILSNNDKIAKVIVQLLILIGNYIISKFLVFKK